MSAWLKEGAAVSGRHTDVMLENVYERLEGLCQGHSQVSSSVGNVVAAACRLGSSKPFFV